MPYCSASSSSIALCLASSLAHAATAAAAALASRLTLGRVAAAVAVVCVAAFLADCALRPRYPRTLPRVGYGDSVLATTRNWLGYVFYFNDWVDEGYRRFSKQDRAFIVPSAASRPQEIVVPRSQTGWMMLDLPDHVLSAHAAHDDVLYTAYNFVFDVRAHARRHYERHRHLYPRDGPPPPPADLEFHTRVMHRNLARHLPGLLPAIEAEVAAAVDAAFGRQDITADPDGWRTLNLWDAWLAMVPRITNLLLVGPDACRNQPMLDAFVQFADTVVTNSFLLNMFPKLFHPVVGRLASIPNHRLWRRAHRHLAPLVHERLRLLTTSSDAECPPPVVNEDYLTWHIRMALAEGRLAELDPEAITKRLLPVEFAAIHTTVLTGFFVILDLLTADPARGFIDGIRDEVAAVRGADTDTAATTWSKPSLARLWRTDSAIRESMRVSHFATSLSKRKVVAPEGVTSPHEGWHVPYGGLLMLNLAGTHHDPDLYEDPDTYDAFRFARQREAYEAEAAARAADDSEHASRDTPASGSEKAAEAMRGLKLGMVTTSDRHLAFGHGRHACPGRFFVAHELKMILAHLVTHYDFKPLAEKPKSLWIGQTIIPPLSVKVQVRRRKV